MRARPSTRSKIAEALAVTIGGTVASVVGGIAGAALWLWVFG